MQKQKDRYIGVVLLEDVTKIGNTFLIEGSNNEARLFKDTDTLYIEFRGSVVSETEAPGEKGYVVFITVEYASKKADINHLTLSEIAA